MKVLVVDDDLAVGEVIVGMLEDLGCDVEIRDGPQPALDWLAGGALPDLVISDVRMPGAHTDDLEFPVLLKPFSQATLTELLEVVRASRSCSARAFP